MSVAAEAEPTPAGPSPTSISCSSKTSSFCSFDVRIWEELHLQSLLSSSINDDHVDTIGAGQLWKAEKAREPKCSQSHSQGFSFFSSSSAHGVSFSGFSSPHRLSNASSQSGFPLIPSSRRRDSTLLGNSPLHIKVEEPPVVQVIQTGSMSFTGDELVVRQASMYSMDAGLPAENLYTSAECKGIPFPEEEESSSNINAARNENGIVLGTLPNAKFLQISAPDVYSASISPLKSAGSIPFKWEEMPGKPKPAADHRHLSKTSIPSLQLPPKLLYSSFPSSNCSSPYNRSRSKHVTGTSSPSSTGDCMMSKSGSVKSLWHSFVQSGRRSYREGGGRSRSNGLLSSDDDPSSPTSILIGPDAGLSSSSSTSSTLDAICASPGRIPEVQSTLGRVRASSLDDGALCSRTTALMPNSSSSSSLFEASAYIGNDLPNLAPSMERKIERTVRGKATDKLKSFLKSCQRWKGLGGRRKRNHEEAEMWEPTLATYFHSMELERASSTSGQALLHEQRASSEKYGNKGNLTPDAIVGPFSSSVETESYIACMNGSYDHDVLKEDVMIFSGKPTCMEKCPMGIKGKNAKVRRKGGGWVLRKLKKSSKVLQDALLRAVSKGTTRGSYPNKKCKRRRLPYQPITC